MIRIAALLLLLAAVGFGGAGLVAGVPAAPIAPARAPDFIGQARVIDGDSLRIGAAHVRLYGIDAPEGAQPCPGVPKAGARCGDWIAGQVRAMVTNRTVECWRRDTDRYDRAVVQCAVGGRDLNLAIVEAGLAFAFTAYSTDYSAAEAEARAARRGIWQGSVTPPWDWRASKREGALQVFPVQGGACVIKGNISSKGERIYHVPGQRNYTDTHISSDKGERWFCSEADARAAGWRKAKR